MLWNHGLDDGLEEVRCVRARCNEFDTSEDGLTVGSLVSDPVQPGEPRDIFSGEGETSGEWSDEAGEVFK